MPLQHSLLNIRYSKFPYRVLHIVIEQKLPSFFFTFLPPLLAKLHALLSVVIVLGNKATAHLLQLRRIVATKKYSFSAINDPICLMELAVRPGYFIFDVSVNY